MFFVGQFSHFLEKAIWYLYGCLHRANHITWYGSMSSSSSTSLDGIATFILSLRGLDKKDPRWYLVGEWAINLAAGILIFIFGGVLAFAFPRVMAVFLLLLVSGRIILIGVLELLVGIVRTNAAPLFRIPIGLSSIVLGLVMIYFQDKKILAFVLPIGIYAIVVGVFLILACLKLKDMNKITSPAKT